MKSTNMEHFATLPSPKCYDSDIPGFGNIGSITLQYAKATVKQFSQYRNTIMFTVANNLLLGGEESQTGYACMPCLKVRKARPLV